MPETTRAVEHIIKARRVDEDDTRSFEMGMLANAGVDLADDGLLSACIAEASGIRSQFNDLRMARGLEPVPDSVPLGAPWEH